MSYEFVVVTDIAPRGARATALGRLFYTSGRPVEVNIQLGMEIPVFTLGEILICDPTTGREIAGVQRKPSKWFIETEWFSNLDEAIHRARIIMEIAEEQA